MQKQWICNSVISVILLVLVVSGVQAANIVVAPAGGDYATLQPAVDAALPGDTVEVRAGTYPGGVVVRTPVTIRGAEGAAVGTTGETAGLIIEADGVTVSGITCDGPEIGILANTTEALQIESCNIVAGDTGILFSGCTNGSVAGTSVLAGRSGLIATSSEGIEIENDWFNGGTTGITLRDARALVLRETALLGCDVGVVAEHCENGTIEAMTFTDVDVGMLGIGCTDLRITGPTLSNMVQYLQMYNALGCCVEADSMEGAEYFAADIFSDTVYACGPWNVSGWNYGFKKVAYDAPEDYLQFGDALNFTIIEEAESLTGPYIIMEAEVTAAEFEGYDAETFGIYDIGGAEPVMAGTTTFGENGSAVTSVTVGMAMNESDTMARPGEYALLAKVLPDEPDPPYLLIAVIVMAGVVFLLYIWRKK